MNKLNNRQDAVRAGIQFDAYSAALTQSAKGKLDTLVKRLPAKSNNFVCIVGFVSTAPSRATRDQKILAMKTISRQVATPPPAPRPHNAQRTTHNAQRTTVTIFPNQKS